MVGPRRFSVLRLLTSISHSCNSDGSTQLQPPQGQRRPTGSVNALPPHQESPSLHVKLAKFVLRDSQPERTEMYQLLLLRSARRTNRPVGTKYQGFFFFNLDKVSTAPSLLEEQEESWDGDDLDLSPDESPPPCPQVWSCWEPTRPALGSEVERRAGRRWVPPLTRFRSWAPGGSERV